MKTTTRKTSNGNSKAPDRSDNEAPRPTKDLPTEIGGQEGPEPTRYGDWEKNGRCTDF